MHPIIVTAGTVGIVFGLVAAFNSYTPPRSGVLYWVHKNIITVSHSWVTVIHELGHWFFGLPSGIISGRVLPRIRFTDSHNAETMMPMVHGPLRWLLHPFYAFGGYASPLILGVFLIWTGLTQTQDMLFVSQIVLTVLTVVMVLGARSFKTFLFCLYPIIITTINWLLYVQYHNNGEQVIVYAYGFTLFLGVVLFVGGLGDIVAVNGWAFNPRKVRHFYSTDFGLLTGFSHEGKNGNPVEPGWSPHPMGPFFFPHVALIIFNGLVILILVGSYDLLTSSLV